MYLKKIILFSTLIFLSLNGLQGQGLLIESGSHLVANGNVALVINDGNLITNGGFNSGSASTVYMKGAAPTTDSKISGTGGGGFQNLVIDKSSNGVQLEKTIYCWNMLQLQSGDLDLNGQDIFMINNSVIQNETANNRIWGNSGRIVKTFNLNAPSNANPGNLGLHMTSTDNLGTFTIERTHQIQTINGSPAPSRQYKIKYFNTGLSIDYQMDYFDTELNGTNEAYLDSWKYNTAWKQRPADALDTMTNMVTINGVSELDTLWSLSAGQLQLTPKILLSGAYDTGGLMKDDLRSAGAIPTTEPYTALGYTTVNCPCDSTTQSVLDATGDNAIVDWALVELRLKSNQDSILQSVTGLLQKDGDIVDVDGVSPLKIPNFPTDSFYVAIKHRNHLGVITPNYQELTPIASNYDFTTDLNNTQGGITGISNLGDGFYALYSGDIDRNGQVQNTDATLLILKLGTSGYLEEDLDMNTQVQNTDLTNKLRPNLGTGVQFNN